MKKVERKKINYKNAKGSTYYYFITDLFINLDTIVGKHRVDAVVDIYFDPEIFIKKGTHPFWIECYKNKKRFILECSYENNDNHGVLLATKKYNYKQWEKNIFKNLKAYEIINYSGLFH